MSELKRVVVTGMGVMSPVGNSLSEFWTSLLEGRSGIGPITLFDASEYPTRIAGEVKNFDPAAHFNSKDVKKIDRVGHLAMVASREAMKNSGLDMNRVDNNRVGVVYGSGIGGITTIENQYKILLEKGPGKISPFFIPMEIIDMTAGLISMEWNARGPNFAIVSACATGSHCIGESARIIQTGDADVMICGAAEAAVSPLGIGGFCALKALSRRNDEPQKASRPFDRDRDGFLLSEGAGTLILEEFEHARARGAHIYGEVAGYGLSGDAYHMTQPAPGGEGGVRAIEMALRKAGCRREQIQYFNAHGTSTKFNDAFETIALKTVFGDYAYRLPVTSTKSVTGHLLAAAGAVELIAVLQAMQASVIPPTWNLDNPDPECDLDYVPNAPREAPLQWAMSNSLGFGGHNATLIVKKI